MTSLYPGELGLVEEPAAPGEEFDWNERREQIRYTLTLSTTTLAEAFDEWFYPAGTDSVIHRNPRIPLLDDTLTRKRVTLWANVDRTDSALVETFTNWLPSAPKEDLFVWIHLLSPHKP